MTLRRAAALICGLAAAGALFLAARAALGAHAELAPARHAVPAEGADLPGLRPLELDAAGLRARGWLVPSRTGAVVVLTHGSSADRRQMLPAARAIVARGHGALLFDWPGHGESDGEIRWDEPERAALRAALDALTAQGVARIGGMGFSYGASVLVQVAARDARLRALLLEAPIADYDECARTEFGRWGALSSLPARLVLRLHGMRPAEQRPLDVVKALAPRPLEIFAGAADPLAPPSSARALLAAAGQGQLWIVPGAAHGGFADAAPAEYARRVGDFFDRALAP